MRSSWTARAARSRRECPPLAGLLWTHRLPWTRAAWARFPACVGERSAVTCGQRTAISRRQWARRSAWFWRSAGSCLSTGTSSSTWRGSRGTHRRRLCTGWCSRSRSCSRSCRDGRRWRSSRRRWTNRSCRMRSRCRRSRLGARRHYSRRRSRRLGRGCNRRWCCWSTRLCHGHSWNCGRARFHCCWRHSRLRWCHRRGRSHARGLRSRFLRFLFRFGSRFRLRFLFGGSLNLLAHFLSDVRGDRARVRLLFRDAIPGQQVNDGLGLDLEFAGKFVDSDLIYVSHALRS